MTHIIYSDNGTLSDITPKLKIYGGDTQTFSWVTAQDYLYLGSQYPFTSKFIKPSTMNSVTSTLSVSYWDGITWRSCASTYDETSVSGVPLARVGYINWQTDKEYPWTADDTQLNSSTNITGLGTVNLDGLYWVRIASSANISMTLDYIGDIFCTDTDVGYQHPQSLDSTFMTNWESGKTSWEAQRKIASDILINKLKVNQLEHENLLLDKSQLNLACVYQTLAIIYRALGDGYTEYTKEFENLATKYLQSSISQDKNFSGKMEPQERGMQTKTMVR